jgi:dipeptidyl aminopeptidase/acylaminoacyl peptidase
MRHLICAVLLVFVGFPAGAAEPQALPIPPNVKVEGMPPIPQSIADDLSRYAAFRDAQLVAWHPTKRQILINTVFGQFPQIHLVDGPGRARTQLTFLPSPGVPRATAAAPYGAASFDPADGNTFVLRRDVTGGTEGYNLYRFDMSTGQITRLNESKTASGPPVWARQGKWIAYRSSERNGKDRDIYVMQPSNPATARRVGDTSGNWDVEDWSPDGSSLLVIEYASNTVTTIWKMHVETGERKPLTPPDGEPFNWFNPRFSADGRHVYALSDKGSGRTRIWRGVVATGAWTPITSDRDEIDAFELSPDGQMMAMVVDRGENTDLQVLDLGTLKPRPLPAIGTGVMSQLMWRPGSREVAFTFASIKSQGDVYSVDTSVGTVTRWTFSEVSFNPDTLPAPEVIHWKSEDGLTLSGILYRPSTKFTGPRPVMVSIHGGPEQRDRVRFQGRSNYFLNELGLAIIYPNVRGSIGFGRPFEEADNGKGRTGAIKDVGGLLDWIAAQPDLDKGRVLLQGPSYGGYLALEAGIVYADRVRCVMAGAAISNLVTFLEQTGPDRQANRRAEYGDERDPGMRAFLLSISPISRASDMKRPTMILHPGSDTRVPVNQAQELVQALKANNVPVWYLEFAGVGHDNFPGSVANVDLMLSSWTLFIKTYLVN